MATVSRPAQRAHRVLIVEDEPAIADALALGLRHVGHDVEIADTGPRALAAVRRRPPDIVLLDLMLPGMDGFAVCRELRSGGHDVGIIVVTARGDLEDRVRGLDAGADDYLTKPFQLKEVLARIRAVARRRRPSADTVLRFGDLTIDPGTREISRNGQAIELTPREFDLLAFFLRHPRRVLGRDELLNAVWGREFEGGPNIVEVYVGYLRRRLGDPLLLHTVRGAGYALREPR